MNKILIPLLLVTLFPSNIFAKEKYTWVITVNTNDCINCIGALNGIGKLNHNYPKEMVFAKGNEPDSAVIIKKFFLKNFKGNIVFDDSLYNKYKSAYGIQESSISLINNNNGKHITLPLTFFTQNEQAVNGLMKNRDTIILNKNVLDKGTFLGISTNRFYVFNSSLGTLKIFDRIGNPINNSFVLNDSTLLKGYIVRYGDSVGSKMMKLAEKYVQLNHLIGSESSIKSIQFNDDTLYLLVKQPTLTSIDPVGWKDARIIPLTTMLIYVNGQLVSVENIDNYLDKSEPKETGIRRNNIKDTTDPHFVSDAYYLSDQFFFYKKSLFISLYSSYLTIGKPNQLLAEFKLKKNKQWAFQQFSASLPSFYVHNRIGYNELFPYIIPSFGPYFTVQFDSTIHSVDPKFKEISLNFLPKLYTITVNGNSRLPEGSFFIDDFKISGNILFILIDQSIGDNRFERRYFKYDLKANKIIRERDFSENELPESLNFVRIDPFDYAYLITSIPENKILRIKAF